MTHDERIEACLDALTNYVDDPDGGYPTDYLRKAVIDILAAAGVEEMIREAAEKAWDVGGMSEPMVLRRIVREVMGK
jgi:hypothetical protein